MVPTQAAGRWGLRFQHGTGHASAALWCIQLPSHLTCHPCGIHRERDSKASNAGARCRFTAAGCGGMHSAALNRARRRQLHTQRNGRPPRRSHSVCAEMLLQDVGACDCTAGEGPAQAAFPHGSGLPGAAASRKPTACEPAPFMGGPSRCHCAMACRSAGLAAGLCFRQPCKPADAAQRPNMCSVLPLGAPADTQPGSARSQS